MYNALVERCFSECVDSFRRKTLEQGEEKCVQRCCEKFLKHSARVSVRFSELNSANDGSVAAQATQQAQPQQSSS
jgi:import inner membrane translocase subunit TIM9